MQSSEYDILIAGGGLAGLLAAAAFGSAGYTVACVDRIPEQPGPSGPRPDARTTALLRPSKSMLEKAGIWEGAIEGATPLRALRIVESNGNAQIRKSVEFDASEIGLQEFGWNVSNRILREILERRIRGLANVSLTRGRAVARILNRDFEAIAELSDGTRLSAKLAIAADGRNSAIRDRLGIDVVGYRSRQTALAFSVAHKQPHGGASIEIHERGGPFTLVPLEDSGGRPSSAVVWMERAAIAERLVSMPRCEFDSLITERSCGVLGRLELISEIGSWPVAGLLANRFSSGRTALIAEAAHVLPPIGAQGLNLSIGDIGSLFSLLQESELAASDFSNRLAAEGRGRRSAALSRSVGVGVLNWVSSWEASRLRRARTFGLAAVGGIDALRQPLMRFGLGAEKDFAH